MEKKITIGIIGAGRMGRIHTTNIKRDLPYVNVKAVSDVYLQGAKDFALKFDVPDVYEDYKKILEDPEIEAVVVCSSTDTHASISMDAAKAGKQIYCDKPIDLDTGKVKQVMKFVEKTGVKFMVGFNRRYDHNFKAIKEAVMAGKIGDPHILKITSRDVKEPPVEYAKVCGGIFLDMTIHDFDLSRYIVGSEVIEVFAMGDCLINPELQKVGDVDTAIITLKFANGAMGVIDNARKTTYGSDQRMEIFGTKGSATVSNDIESSCVISCEDGIIAEKPLYSWIERYSQSYPILMEKFIDAVINNKEVPININDGYQANLIAEAAKKSIQERRPIKISEIEALY